MGRRANSSACVVLAVYHVVLVSLVLCSGHQVLEVQCDLSWHVAWGEIARATLYILRLTLSPDQYIHHMLGKPKVEEALVICLFLVIRKCHSYPETLETGASGVLSPMPKLLLLLALQCIL